MSDTTRQNDMETVPVTPENAEKVDTNGVPSAVLERLIEEVRHESVQGPDAYNRTHNRHNRSR